MSLKEWNQVVAKTLLIETESKKSITNFDMIEQLTNLLIESDNENPFL